MNKSRDLELPISEEKVRTLRCGDVVYLSGVIYTMRDMGHRRAVDMLQRGEKLPFDLATGAIWHCAPIVRKHADGKWDVVSAGPTTSSRFTYLGSDLIKMLKIRCTIGKGTMMQTAVDAMKNIGSCFLNATGGCAALHAEKVQEVVDVFWTDLGLPEATWVMRVKDLGPLIVGIDSHGHSLYHQMGKTVKTRIEEVLAKAAIRRDYNYAYLPRRVPGKASSN